MKHAGAALAVPLAALATYLLYLGLPFWVLGVSVAVVVGAVQLWRYRRNARTGPPAAPEDD